MKYKVWDKERNVFENIGVIDLDSGQAWDYYNFYDGYGGKSYPVEELIPCIGFIDYAGRDVYLGDFVQFKNGYVYLIGKNDDELGFCCKYICKGKYWNGSLFTYKNKCYATIIGNIQENPQFLDKITLEYRE